MGTRTGQWQVGEVFEVWWQETACFAQAEVIATKKDRVCLCIRCDHQNHISWFSRDRVEQLQRLK